MFIVIMVTPLHLKCPAYDIDADKSALTIHLLLNQMDALPFVRLYYLA
jgi:hypothetical protein